MVLPVPHHVALAGRLASEIADRLAEAAPQLETRVVDSTLTPDELGWADTFVGFRPPRNLADSRIVWVHSMAAGVDPFVPVLGALEPPPLLTRTVGRLPHKLGLYVAAHLLAESQHVVEYVRRQERREWSPVPGVPCEPATAVVLGTGTIGSGIAGVLRPLGYRMVGVNHSGHPSAAFDEVRALAEAHDRLGACDALVCALPLTEETRGIVDRSLLADLHGATFVNVGRGGSVREDDLREALDDGRVRRAILDVVEHEPLPETSWMWAHERVTITPHVGAITDADDVLAEFLPACASLAAGELPKSAVDLGRGY